MKTIERAQKLLGKPYFLVVSTTCEACGHVWSTKSQAGTIVKVEYWERGGVKGPVLPEPPKPAMLPDENSRCPKCGELQSWKRAAQQASSERWGSIGRVAAFGIGLYVIYRLARAGVDFVLSLASSGNRWWSIGGGIALGIVLLEFVRIFISKDIKNIVRKGISGIRDSFLLLLRCDPINMALFLIGLPVFVLVFRYRFTVMDWRIFAGSAILPALAIGMLLIAYAVGTALFHPKDKKPRVEIKSSPNVHYIYDLVS